MQIRYQIESLDGLLEIDPYSVEWETATQCPVCRSDRLVELCRLRDSLVTAWCENCAHAFHQRKPTAPWYENWYRRHWDSPPSSSSRWLAKNRWVLTRSGKRIGKRLAAGAKRYWRSLFPRFIRGSLFDDCRGVLHRDGSVLDIGCGYGRALAPFQQYGCRAFGIEASPHRAAAAREKGIQVADIPVEQLGPHTFGRRFDLVISNHVLEHVYDPHAFLQAVRRVLRPGGWLFLAVPNFEQDFLLHDFFFALHIHFFSRHSLRQLVKPYGFDVRRLLQQHELRLLAQHQANSAGRLGPLSRPNHKSPRTGRWSHPTPLGLDEHASLPTNRIAPALLGAEYQNNGHRGVTCCWRLNTRAVDRRFDVVYSAHAPAPQARPSEGLRMMHMRWEDETDPTITFFSPTGPAPFWVK